MMFRPRVLSAGPVMGCLPAGTWSLNKTMIFLPRRSSCWLNGVLQRPGYVHPRPPETSRLIQYLMRVSVTIFGRSTPVELDLARSKGSSGTCVVVVGADGVKFERSEFFERSYLNEPGRFLADAG